MIFTTQSKKQRKWRNLAKFATCSKASSILQRSGNFNNSHEDKLYTAEYQQETMEPAMKAIQVWDCLKKSIWLSLYLTMSGLQVAPCVQPQISSPHCWTKGTTHEEFTHEIITSSTVCIQFIIRSVLPLSCSSRILIRNFAFSSPPFVRMFLFSDFDQSLKYEKGNGGLGEGGLQPLSHLSHTYVPA